MAELFASGRIVDLILVLMALEALFLLFHFRRTGRGVRPGDLFGYLLSGAALLLAMRAALTGAAWPWLALFLLTALIAHLLDLRRRWR